MPSGRWPWAAIVLLIATTAAAEQRIQIAPGVEKIIHANGHVEYRQAGPAAADSAEQPAPVAPARSIYKHGSNVFSDQLVHNGRQGEKWQPRFDCYACKVRSGVNWETTPLFTGRYEQEIQRYASEHGVSPALVKAVIHAESAFNPQARSKVGAQGLMQLMPGTATELGVTRPFDPEQNIDGGVRYLAMLLRMYDNDMRLATAAYNAGPGAVKRYNGVPAFPETRAYVQRVAILERRYRHGL